MLSMLVGPVLNIIGKVLDKTIPDKNIAQQIQASVLTMSHETEIKEMDTQFQLALKQNEVNNSEAQSDGNYKGGWRPYIGWICGTGLGLQFLVFPCVQNAINLYHGVAMIPLDMSTLMTLLFGMLGLGALRTVEKIGK